MKVNYDQPILGLDNKPFTGDDGAPMLLKQVVIMACSMAIPGDDKLDGIAKYRVGEIAATISKGLDLTAEQVATAKERIAMGFTSPTLIYYVHNLLEGKEQ